MSGVEPDQPPFPHFMVVHGVAAVAIPAAEYRRLKLLDVRGAFEETLKALRRMRRGPAPLPSMIQRDPEVATFLRERLALADTLEMAHQACVERFGAARAPSTGRIARFRNKIRAGA